MDFDKALSFLDESIYNPPYVASFSCMALMVLIFNSIFIYTVSRSRGLQNITNKILLSLAVSDLLHGAIFVPLFIINVIPNLQLRPLVCVTLNSLQTSGNAVAAMHLLIVTAERYLAIIFPLRHRLLLVSRKLPLLVVLCWVPPIVLGCTPFMSMRYFHQNNMTGNDTLIRCHFFATVSCSYIRLYLGVMSVVLLITWLCYAHILIIAIRQGKTSPDLSRQPTTASRTSGLKAVKVLMSTVGYNTITTLPVFILLGLKCCDHDFHILSWTVCMLLYYSNSVLDPVIYGLGSKSIRDAFVKNVLKRLCSQCFRSHSDIKETVMKMELKYPDNGSGLSCSKQQSAIRNALVR